MLTEIASKAKTKSLKYFKNISSKLEIKKKVNKKIKTMIWIKKNWWDDLHFHYFFKIKMVC